MPKEKEVKPPVEETTIQKPKRAYNKKKKGTTFALEEIQEKFTKLFDGLSYFLKIDNDYEDSDFQEESKDLIRLSQKYPLVGDILTLLDPLFLVLGLFSKLNTMFKKSAKVRGEQQEHKGGDGHNPSMTETR